MLSSSVVALLDVILGYDCNLACDYCTITPAMRARSLPAAQVVEALARGRALGYDEVSFTGGEPTIRRDLVGLIAAARAHGYQSIKLQSNGLLLAHGPNVDALVRAGVTRFHVSIHAHEAEHYERLVQREGTHSLMVQALDELVARKVTLIADVIIKRDTYDKLENALDWLFQRGLREAHLWFVSLTDHNRDNVHSMPRMTEVVPAMRRAFATARARGMLVRSLHVPRCLLASDHAHAWDPGAGRVMVVTPESTFELRDSKLAGRVHVPACEGCEWRAICPGVRPDYVEVYGDEEIARARGQAPRVAPVRALPVVA